MQNIIITGASSGLGKALAENLAGAKVRLHLIGRNNLRLEHTADSCRKKQAEVFTHLVDVSSLDEMTRFYHNIRDQKITHVFASAAISMERDKLENASEAKELFETNMIGVSNTVLPAAEIMASHRDGGKIIIIGSIAGEIAFPSSPSYVASKAALKIFAHALSVNLRKHNILVSMVLPGYIKTAMTQNNKHPMPMIISADKAAKIIIKGVDQNQPLIIFPKILYYLVRFLKILPRCMIDYILHKMPKKG